MILRFELEPADMKKLEAWLDKKDLTSYTGAIGGRLSYHFTPTTLGTALRVTDNLDGSEIDLTDYESW